MDKVLGQVCLNVMLAGVNRAQSVYMFEMINVRLTYKGGLSRKMSPWGVDEFERGINPKHNSNSYHGKLSW